MEEKKGIKGREISCAVSWGTEGLLGIMPPSGEKPKLSLPLTKHAIPFLCFHTKTAWAEFHSLTSPLLSPVQLAMRNHLHPDGDRNPSSDGNPPRMPCDAVFLNLEYLGGRHITVFGFPVLPKDQALPATIRDSSRSFSVGSKNQRIITNTAGDRSFGALNGSSNRLFQ